MLLQRSKRLFLGITILFYIVYLTVLLKNIQPLREYTDLFELGGIFLSFPIFAVAIVHLPKAFRLVWLGFALTALFSFSGEGLWSYFYHVQGFEPESPSLCDVFYLLCYFPCISALLYFLKIDKRINFTHVSLDLLISFIASAGIISIFFVEPVLSNQKASFLALLIQVSFPVLDLILLFECLILFFNSTSSEFYKPSIFLIIIGFMIIFFADQCNLLEVLYDLNITSYLELLWPIAYILLAFSGLLFCEELTKQSSLKVTKFQERLVEVIRLLTPYLLTFSVLIFICINYNLYNLVYAWAMLLLIILSVRQIFVLIRNKQLNKELHALNVKIRHDAEVDFLTQLYNRRYINSIAEELESAKKDKDPLGIFIIDVDFFKQINDAYGHQTGDQVLQKVASIIRGVMGENAICGRYGGDEFIIFLPKATLSLVRDLGKRLLDAIHADKKLKEFKVTLSIGGSAWDSVTEDLRIHNLMKLADAALYQAKETGRDTLVVLASDGDVEQPAHELL
ncbi:MAG: GGDEF domain-containing protein [Desulfovibrio sp.]|nr:GGDEF domain-containing protein [Desulfovibrio sp.]